MKFHEVRDILKGYVEYIAIMNGLDMKIIRSKKFNEYQYWVKDDKIMTAEMGDVRNQVMLRFYHMPRYYIDFTGKYNEKNYDFKYDYHFNTVSISVYNIDQLRKVLDLFNEIGFFEVRQ